MQPGATLAPAHELPRVRIDPSRTLHALFDRMQIRHDASRLRRSLETHPEFPGTVAVLETLDAYGLDATVRRADAEDLDRLRAPALAHVRQGASSGLVAVAPTTTGGLECVLSGEGWRPVSRAVFDRVWSGVIVDIDPAADAGEIAISAPPGARARHGLTAALASSCLVLAGWLVPTAGGARWQLLAHALVAALGLAACIPLVLGHLGSTGALRRFCPTRGRSSCAAVTGSRFGTVAGVPLADLAALHFAARLVSVGLGWIAGSGAAIASLLASTSILAAPVVLAGAWIQARVLRRWCPLCLAISAALVLDAAVSAAADWTTPSLHALGLHGLSFAGVALAWMLMRPLVAGAIGNVAAEDALVRQLRSPRFLRAALADAPSLPPRDGLPRVLLGDPDASMHVTVVAKLQCAACSGAVRDLERMARMHPGGVSVEVVLLPGEPAVAKILLDIVGMVVAGASRSAVDALLAWYAEARSPAQRGSEGRVDARAVAGLDRVARWAADSGIRGTPTVAIDGRILPLGCSADSVRAVLFDVAEEQPPRVATGAST